MKKKQKQWRQWYKKNGSALKAKLRIKYAKNAEEFRAKQRIKRIGREEKFNAATRRWRTRNPNASRNYNEIQRKKILTLLGGKCSNPACQWLNADGTRGCTDGRCLQIDHINGGGHLERKIIGYSVMCRKLLANYGAGYQLLCANCNWIKKYQNREVAKPRK